MSNSVISMSLHPLDSRHVDCYNPQGNVACSQVYNIKKTNWHDVLELAVRVDQQDLIFSPLPGGGEDEKCVNIVGRCWTDSVPRL